jgi:outer membrane autotransporter protein
MAKKSNFLKNLLTTASAFAVIAGASNAMAGTARVLLNNGGTQDGANLDQDSGAPANNILVADGSTLTFRDAHTYTATGGISLAGISVNTNFEATLNADDDIAFTIGSIVKGAGNTGSLTINTGAANAVTITLSGAASNVTAYTNTKTVLKDWAFNAVANDYSGLGAINFQNAADRVILGGSATLFATINGSGADQDTFEVNAADAVFKGVIGGAARLGTLQINAAKNATLDANATIKAITLAAGSKLKVTAGRTITAETLENDGGTGILTFDGAATAAIDKVGNANVVNLVEIGAGQVDFTTTTVYKATTTHLKDAASIVKFSKANALDLVTDFTTETNGAGTIVVGNEARTFSGLIGTDAKRIKELQLTSNHALVFDKANTKLYVNDVTTAADANGTIKINQNNFEIHANIGATGNTFNTVTIGNAAAAITTKLMEGKSIFANRGVILSDASANNILELYNDSAIIGAVTSNSAGNGIISVKGDSSISKGVDNSGGQIIDQIRFDTAKTLTLGINKAQTNNVTGINFLEDGTLELKGTEDFTFNKIVATKVDANGTGTIRANVAGLGKTLTFTDKIGDDPVGNNLLKLLEAKNGANIILGESSSIKKVDIQGADSTLTLNGAAGKYFIGDFSHSDNQGTLAIGEDLTLLKGSTFGTQVNRMKAITFTGVGSKTLTIQDGINLYTTTNDATGGIRNTGGDGKGVLIFEGTSVVGAAVGSNNKFNQIKVTGADKTVTFEEKVNLTNGGINAGNIFISNGATVILQKEVVAEDIQGALADQGTVKFKNTTKLAGVTAINSTIGATEILNTVDIGGADITFTKDDFKTTNLVFSSADKMTATFEAIAVNTFKNMVITSTGNGIHNIALSKNISQEFNNTVGAADNALGNIIINNTDGKVLNDLATFNAGFYGSVTTVKNQTGLVTLGGINSVANNLGSDGLELRKINFDNTLTVGNMWSKDANIAAGKTITFKGVVASSVGLTLQNGATANFSGPNVALNAVIIAANAVQGVARFDDTASITKDIGAQVTKLQSIDFTGTKASQVASVGANLYATNINIGAQTFQPTTNIKLSGATLFNGSAINLAGPSEITLQSGVSKLAGDVTLGLTLNNDVEVGNIIVDGSAGAASFDVNNANSVKLVITDNGDLPVTAETYDLITTINGGTATDLITKGMVVQPTSNRFVKWTLINDNKVVRENNAEQALVAIIGKLNDAELLADAKLYGNPNNKGDAQAYTSELSKMTDAQIQESLERLTEQNAVHATAIVGQTTATVNNSINNRIALLTNHPQAGMQTASAGTSGVAAGDDRTKFGAWISPFYSISTQKEQGSRAGYKTQSTGGSIGFDTEVNADMTLGLAGSFVKTDVKHKNFKAGDKTKLDTFMFSIYGIQQLTESWFLQAHVSYASSKIKNTEKRITLAGSQNATGSFDTTSYSGELLAGYNVTMADAVVTPMVGASFTRVNDGGYKETGTTNQNLTISRKDANKVEAIVGLRAQMTSHMSGIDMTPEFHGFVRHDVIGKSSKVSATNVGLVGQIAPKTAKIQKTTFNVGAGVNAVSGMYEYGAGYDLFLANKLMGHQGTLKVRVNF